MIPVVCTTQIERALSRLTQQYRNQPNIIKLLTSLLVGIPELEATAWSVINLRILSNLETMVAASQNTADQLDIIGSLVGVARLGRTDAQYLPAIKLQIRVNRSQGRSEDVIDIMRLTGLSFVYTEASDTPATFRIDSYETSEAQAIAAANAVKHGRSGGTHGAYTYTNYPRAPLTVAGPITFAVLIWAETDWANTLGGDYLTIFPSSLGA